jgi:hypothetical protein
VEKIRELDNQIQDAQTATNLDEWRKNVNAALKHISQALADIAEPDSIGRTKAQNVVFS